MGLSATKIIFPAAALLLLLPASCVYPAFESNSGPDIRLNAIEKVIPSVTAPPVVFTIRSYTPKSDIFFAAGEDELSSISAWQIQIFDQSGRKISFIQGKNRPPAAAIPWTGCAATGEALPDGFYNARFTWMERNKQLRTSPKISVNLSTPLDIRKLTSRKLKFSYTDEGLVVSITEDMIFQSGQSEIQAKAIPALQEISLFLKSYSKNLVAIRGYTDSSGSARANMALSRKRAASVYNYLVKAGIDPQCLTYKGLGAAQPIASNKTEAGKSRNRRVEIVVLKTTI